MNIDFSGKTHDTIVDVVTILGISVAGWGNLIHILIAALVGITLIVKNVYDILIKREERRKIKRENESNEKNIIVP
jgi:hypothetical protein